MRRRTPAHFSWLHPRLCEDRNTLSNPAPAGRVLVRSGDTLELGDVELVVTCEREAPVEQKTPKPKVP